MPDLTATAACLAVVFSAVAGRLWKADKAVGVACWIAASVAVGVAVGGLR